MRLQSKALASLQLMAAGVTVGLPTAVTIFAVVRAAHQGVHPIALWLAVLLYFLSLLGITAGFHRYGAHRAFEPVRWVRGCLVVLGSMAAQGPIVHWVSNHRRHHQFSDELGDPHSPHAVPGAPARSTLRGFWHAHVGWLFAGDITNAMYYSKDLLRDHALMRLNRTYLLWVGLGLALPAAIAGAVVHSWSAAFDALLWAGFVRVFLAHHATWSINSVAHLWGSRPYFSSEHSVNVAWLAVPSAGESWHNSHHAFPGSARFGLMWWQLDLGYVLIRSLQVLGLASKVHVPSAAVIANSRRKASLQRA
jgi:stearoyl-CoA desaturase (delta-9 desaturase)